MIFNFFHEVVLIEIFLYILVFALGAIVASFMGVVSARLNTGQSFLTGRSRCDACNVNLSSFSLIPIFSYLFFKSKSYCCNTRISFLSPLTEILLGVLFVLAYLKIGFNVTLVFFLISLSLLLALVLYDLTHKILPSPLLYLFIIASLVTSLIANPSFEVNSLFSPSFVAVLRDAFIISASLLVIHFLSRGRAMGFADAPFAFGLAVLVGQNALSGFIFSFWIGAVIGIGILLKRAPGSRIGVEVPFAPFLAAGFLLAYFMQFNIFSFNI